ncbi:MAG: methylenetetrahydrofolate reductase [NAD(P)H] [Planctomycetota bacterium]
MKIRDLFARAEAVFSFEFFPPKTDRGVENLYRTVKELKRLSPSFVSVTYGAGGSTRDRTIDLVGRIKNEIGIEAMAHLTCVGASREDTDRALARLKLSGIKNILALRGDPPEGQTVFQKAPDGFGHANELVEHIRAKHDFCIGGAFYPEGHVECPDRDQDLRNLKRKVDAGADFLVSQLFFDNSDYFGAVGKARKLGINVPMVPGIMPITNVSQVKRFTSMCGVHIPATLLERLEGAGSDPNAVVKVGVEHATRQCQGLLEGGAPGIHFYTLNQSPVTIEIFRNLKALDLV